MPNAFTKLIILSLSGLLLMTGCTPNLQIGGAYFPAWIICMVVGIFGSMLIRLVFVLTGVDRHITPRIPAYPSLMLAITLLTWLLFYSR